MVEPVFDICMTYLLAKLNTNTHIFDTQNVLLYYCIIGRISFAG